MQIIRSIQNRIYEIRVLNQAVKRNSKRFPTDFMFQLSKDEFESLRLQIEAVEMGNSLTSQIVTLKTGRGQHRKFMPYAFTELCKPLHKLNRVWPC